MRKEMDSMLERAGDLRGRGRKEGWRNRGRKECAIGVVEIVLSDSSKRRKPPALTLYSP